MDSDEVFEAQVGPLRDALWGLIEASSNMRERAGLLPDTESRAMHDLSFEHEYRGAWGDEPVEFAITIGDQLLHAGEDHCTSICTLFDRERDPVPVYGHWVLARAALEAFGRSWLISHPNISVRLRIARGRNERLNSLNYTAMLGDDAHREKVKHSRTTILDDAKRLGFARPHPDQVWLEEERPGPSVVVATILDSDDDDQEPIGPLTMNFYSLSVHSAVAGLGFALGGADDAPGPEALSKIRSVVTRSHDVVSVFIVLMLGHIRCVEQRRAFMGWNDPDSLDAIGKARATSNLATQMLKAVLDELGRGG